MSLSAVLQSYLGGSHIGYQLLEHPLSCNAIESARYSHISPDLLVKAVVVKAAQNYMVCVLPASHTLVLGWIDRDYSAMHRGHHQLATTDELRLLFPDCEMGGVPALGQAYGLKVVWDSALRHADELYLEAGDHRHLYQVNGDEFIQLMENCDHATISCTPEALDFYHRLH